MLLDFPQGPILKDGSPIIENLRLNLAPNQKARAKMNIIRKNGNGIPVDIMIYKYMIPKLDGLSVYSNVTGKELIHDIPFTLKLAYSVPKGKWLLSGNVGSTHVNRGDLNEPMDIIWYLRDILSTIIPA